MTATGPSRKMPEVPLQTNPDVHESRTDKSDPLRTLRLDNRGSIASSASVDTGPNRIDLSWRLGVDKRRVAVYSVAHPIHGRLRHTDPDHLVTPELVWIAAYGKRHRFTFFERCFETLLILVDFILRLRPRH